jgi:hypothetical protein
MYRKRNIFQGVEDVVLFALGEPLGQVLAQQRPLSTAVVCLGYTFKSD